MTGRTASLRDSTASLGGDPGGVEDAVDGSSGSLAPAVTRAAAILDLLAADPAASLGTSELSRRLGMPKSSMANICAALVEARLLRRVGQGYALGRRLAELGGAYLAAVDQIQEFHEATAQLETASEETMQLAVLDGLEVTYIARHDGRQPIRLASEIGRRLPANCTAIGKAAMAALDPDELADRVRGVQWLPTMTRHSHRTVSALLADLEGVRERGYAIDDEETAEGVICYGISIPRRGAGQGPYGASVTLLKARVTPEHRAELVADLRRLAELLSNPLQPTSPGLTRS
jgi:DNA-binding IclR family transcriptional regulator